MRTGLLTIAMLLCISPWQAHASTDVTTLKEAMEMAGNQHPELKMSELGVEAARGQLTEQGSYAYNPELLLEPQRRRLNSGGRTTDYYITLTQGIEIAGKRGYRETAARAALDEATQSNIAIRQQLEVDAARAFVALYFAKNILELRSRQRAMLKQLDSAISRQLEVGTANLLEVNLARSTFASALSAETDARQAFALAQAQYYIAIGSAEDGRLIQPELPRLLTTWEPPEDPLDTAFNSRADFAALNSRATGFDARAELASAERIPDPTFSLMSGKEDGEQLVKVGISFPIPVLNSRKGAERAALAEASRSRSDLAWFEKRLQLEVKTALHNHNSAMQAVGLISRQRDADSSTDNIRLAQTAFDAGELSLEALVIHINQALDGRLTAMNIMKQGWFARIRLAEVLGHPEYILQGIQ